MTALKGIRVLDLSRVLAGPLCAQLLADNGAEVVKIEAPSGDENRRWPPLANGESPNFHSVNRGKKFVSLDLKSERGVAIVHEIAKTCDVVVTNYLPHRAKSLRIDYDTIKAINPRAIYVSITGYGAKGEMTDRPGYDTMVNAFAGIMNLTGDPDRPPVRAGISALDMTSGFLAYGAAVTALFARDARGGLGQKVDLSLMETGVALLGYHATNWLHAGHLAKREGSRNTRLVPYGPYRCKDNELLMIGAPNDAAWRRLLDALGHPELDQDARFCSLLERTRHEPEVREALEAILVEKEPSDWFRILDAAGIACSPINSIDQVLSHPQVLINDMVVELPRSDGGSQRLVGVPFKLEANPANYTTAAKPLGADNVAVLTEILGMTVDQVGSLCREGVLHGGDGEWI